MSTLQGIRIDLSDEHENAKDSIRTNREGNSNEIDKSDLHQEKQYETRSSTVLGIVMDRIAERERIAYL
jgi:hypothetical protein